MGGGHLTDCLLWFPGGRALPPASSSSSEGGTQLPAWPLSSPASEVMSSVKWTSTEAPTSTSSPGATPWLKTRPVSPVPVALR